MIAVPESVAVECHAERVRRRVVVCGIVQGVGFRPFVYREARSLGLAGWVMNAGDGLVLEAEGADGAVRRLLETIRGAAPANAVIDDVRVEEVPASGDDAFRVLPSGTSEAITTSAPPDFATCAQCFAEVSDPRDRRFRYAFTSCTQCGPRFSIIERLPYERSRTSMARFPMCAQCLAEYDDPGSRRFHAETNACPACGPQLSLWDAAGRVLSRRHAALTAAVVALREGRVVAVKGLGGFHLAVDACNERAVARLRERKRRLRKPFATMFPSLEILSIYCNPDPAEIALLAGPQAPIVLVARRDEARVARVIAPAVAPGNPRLGAMLPYTPLHQLLLAELASPIVATSANVCDEPIVLDEHDALERLAGVADVFLVHDRPILRPVDDSVVRLAAGRPMFLRRARGYAPTRIRHAHVRGGVLALGGHLKATIAVTAGRDIVLSQHLGTLDTPASRSGYERAIDDVLHLNATEPQLLACDLHPDYFSTRRAERGGLPVARVQHHVAHVCACMAEHGLVGPALGVAWDGTGYGSDGTVWGGEFLRVHAGRYRRVAHLRPFRLPGGSQAVREPRRSALGVLYEIYGADAFERVTLAPVASFTARQRQVLRRVLARGTHAPLTSSAGRLFDAAAAIVGLCQWATYEGEAAAMLEWALEGEGGGGGAAGGTGAGGFALREVGDAFAETRWIVDWGPAIEQLIAAHSAGLPVAALSAAFHDGLAAAIVAVAVALGERTVVLTGGCFQNAYLTTAAARALRAAGFEPRWHERVPPNDGGLALGQALAASYVDGGADACA